MGIFTVAALSLTPGIDASAPDPKPPTAPPAEPLPLRAVNRADARCHPLDPFLECLRVTARTRGKPRGPTLDLAGRPPAGEPARTRWLIDVVRGRLENTGPEPAPAPPPPTPEPAPDPVAVGGEGWPWEALAACESTGDRDGVPPHRIDPTAHNPSGVYHGAFQFDLPTAADVGIGDPHLLDYSAQKAAAQRLHSLRGFDPWPDCRVRLGL